MFPLWDSQPRRRRPTVTLLLVAANLGVFSHEIWLLLAGGRALDAFLIEHALVPARLVAGWRDPSEWLTMATAMFLHGSGAHVLGNLWFLWIFGGAVENRLGSGWFLLLYFGAGVAAAGLQLATDPGSTVPIIGASGAVSGVLGAYFRLFPRAWIVALVPWVVPLVPVPAVVFLILWFLLQTVQGVGALFEGTVTGGVAWWAHIGGFIAGALWKPRAARGRVRNARSGARLS
jgi:membrane associated rhomboid family serine protease